MKKKYLTKNVDQLWVRLAELRKEMERKNYISEKAVDDLIMDEKFAKAVKDSILSEIRNGNETLTTKPTLIPTFIDESVNTKVKFDVLENYVPIKKPFNPEKAREVIAEKMYDRIIKTDNPLYEDIETFLKLIGY